MDLDGNAHVNFGGPLPGQGNIITGNTPGWGTLFFIRNSPNLKIQGNKIGLTKSGAVVGNNGATAVYGYGDYFGSNVVIGGPNADEGNSIADNKMTNAGLRPDRNNSWKIQHNTIYGFDKGVVITGYGTNAINNSIRQNSIYGNNSLGIDLNNDGPTANDLLDPDTGPNNLQNYPVITASMIKCDGTTDTKNVPMFNSTPNTTFTIDYYANPSWNPSSGKPRQGEQWVSSETVTTDANGNADLNLSLINSMTYPSVTATDPQGNTSEFGSINNMSFTQCQDMVQKTLADTSKDMYLQASWTGSNVPNTRYANYPTWDGSQYIDNIQKTGLTFKITVGGQELRYTEPIPRWSNAYNLNNNNWSAQGHTATPLPEGTYDVVLTVTDPFSGLSMTKTYKDAVKVALPKVNYTTTFTNNSTPTLTGTASGVLRGQSGLYAAYILPKGSPAPNPSLNPGDPGYVVPRVLQYVADTTKDTYGNTTYLDTGSFKVITNKQAIIDAWTADHDLQLANWAVGGIPAGWYFWDWIGWWLNDASGTDWTIVKTVDQLKAACANPTVPQTLSDNWGDPTLNTQASCEAFIQQRYDTDKAGFDQDLQNRIDALNATPSSYDTSSLSQGTYDVYFLGNDLSYSPFQKGFPGGLIVDFTTPTVTLTTTTATATISPQLNGAVSDPTATVTVTINGTTYTVRNNGDGTWTLPAGSIPGGLLAGTYSVTVTVRSLAGNTSTEVKTLTVQAAPAPAAGGLAPTGQGALVFVEAGIAVVVLGSAILASSYASKRRRHHRSLYHQ